MSQAELARQAYIRNIEPPFTAELLAEEITMSLAPERLNGKDERLETSGGAVANNFKSDDSFLRKLAVGAAGTNATIPG